jgi:phage tail sheath protein FI
VAAVGTPTAALNSPFPPAGATAAPYAAPPFLTGGYDGAVLDPTLDGASGGLFMTALNADGTGTGGVRLLDKVSGFNLLCVPGESEATTIQNLQAYCFNHRAFYIVDSPSNATTAGLISSGPAGADTGSITGQYSINSAYYYPWVMAPDPLMGNRQRAFPPCGFVAGLYATTDATRGVWKAPAGIDASLTGISGLQTTLTDIENGNLNTQAINCLREFKVYGDVLWGARTLQGNDQAGSQWKYVPIRRLALFIESSLYSGTQWVVFEPNDQALWGQIRLNIGAFMQGLFLQGAFQGTSPQQAYFVKCDAENNPQASIDLGVVNILVGFAPLYPAEFVVIQIQQMAGQSQ